MNEDMAKRFEAMFREQFPYAPTPGQETAIKTLIEFLFSPEPNELFLLKGYAGTGKTTLISAFVKTLSALNAKTVLLAPTGRAAKVLGGYAGMKAHTLHRYLYFHFTAPDGSMRIIPRANKDRDTVFIVDEVSMISGNTDSQEGASLNILEDLFKYVHSGENCKLVFVGDKAQLPPVGLEISPALDEESLNAGFHLNLYSVELKDVVRQEAASGILQNATSLRRRLETESYDPPFFDINHDDVRVSNGSDLLEELNSAFYNNGTDSAVIVTRSNKRANQYNQEIRNRILFRENEIDAGDLMMVVKNNYYWLPEDSKAGFIANGDIVEILRIRKIEEIYGFRFADVTIRLIDYPDEKEIDVTILLDTIQSESANLPREKLHELFNTIMLDFDDVPQKRMRIKKTGETEHFNALQVKFAYAMTCHKTQGGQWSEVFIDQGYLTDEMLDKEYLRWLYTAITRATANLSLMGFQDKYLKS